MLNLVPFLFVPVENAFTLHAEITGKNPQRTGTYFGLDCVAITPVGTAN